jgi:hypothetical protein
MKKENLSTVSYDSRAFLFLRLGESPKNVE